MKFGKKISGALSYNEQKVKHGSAELILASRFGRDIDELGFSQKVERFEKLNSLNHRTKTNTLHVALSFLPEDQLDEDKLRLIAMSYMDRIGFGEQPFLVYLHKDTSHPHLHIVTSTIKPDGKAIYLHNLAKRKSEPARKAIEIEYDLIRAEGRKNANYISATAKISTIVSKVVEDYKFATMIEFNAILRQFGIMADGGEPGSFLHNKKGLIYYRVDDDGYKTGKGIKASALYNAPIFSTLEKKFEKGAFSKKFYLPFVTRVVNQVLIKSGNPNEFVSKLKEANIGCSVEYDRDSIKSVSFIDHQRRTVFCGEDLGITIEALATKLSLLQPSTQTLSTDKKPPIPMDMSNEAYAMSFPSGIIKILSSQENYQTEISPEFLKKKRKKKKR